MKKYFYKCFDCGEVFDKDEIENSMQYLCPDCGKVDKNSPLRGILQIFYDYDSIKIKYRKEDLFRLPSGKFWLYDFLWPLESGDGQLQKINSSVTERLSLNSSPVVHLHYGGKDIYVLDDTRNPTLSFKDRATGLVAMKAIQLGIDKISAASTGNAGSSLAGLCARLGLKSVVFVPKNIPDAKRIQIQSFGADLRIVNGDYDLAFDECLAFSFAEKIYNRNTAYNPLTIEGKKSAAYDIFISSRGNIPDTIFVPSGDGVIIAGIYKGFWELNQLGWIDKIPKLIAVQSRGSNAIVNYCATGKFEYRPASSVADSICAGAPRNLYMAAEAIKQSGGEAIEVSDEEIIEAQQYSARNYGLLIEPAAAASLAGFINYRNRNENFKAMLLFTGHGLKDLASLNAWNKI